MPNIPASVEEVSPAWLSDAIGCEVDSAEIEQIGMGIGVSSALYRARLIGGEGCPGSVVVKLPALDPAAVFTSTILRMYIREVRFFERLAAESPVRVPKSYFSAVDPDSSRFVVVMEDMGGMRMVDQLEGMDIADAERAVDELALWHARWWREADALVDSGVSVSLADPIYPAVLPLVFAEGWEKVTNEIDLSTEIMAVGPRWSEALPQLLADLAAPPTTLAHGDYRADNILFAPDGSVVLLDFQLIGTGTGAYDLAYFVTQSLDQHVASTHERSLFERWVAGLRGAGVDAGDLDVQWSNYRKAALLCLV